MLSRGLNYSLLVHSEVSTSLRSVTQSRVAVFCFVLCIVVGLQYTFVASGMFAEHLPYARHHLKWREKGSRDQQTLAMLGKFLGGCHGDKL